ncbi:hypothetical protein HDU93_008021 [Gonapodya sp. JEL0774]|nr:hypothetical protein HDU93_008021 [Gonapodya sp. JEL0774]
MAQYEAVKSFVLANGHRIGERTMMALWAEVRFGGLRFGELERVMREGVAPTPNVIDAMLAIAAIAASAAPAPAAYGRDGRPLPDTHGVSDAGYGSSTENVPRNFAPASATYSAQTHSTWGARTAPGAPTEFQGSKGKRSVENLMASWGAAGKAI